MLASPYLEKETVLATAKATGTKHALIMKTIRCGVDPSEFQFSASFTQPFLANTIIILHI
jgi:hypothetical protein